MKIYYSKFRAGFISLGIGMIHTDKLRIGYVFYSKFIDYVHITMQFIDYVYITTRWGKVQQNIDAHECIKFRN